MPIVSYLLVFIAKIQLIFWKMKKTIYFFSWQSTRKQNLNHLNAIFEKSLINSRIT